MHVTRRTGEQAKVPNSFDLTKRTNSESASSDASPQKATAVSVSAASSSSTFPSKPESKGVAPPPGQTAQARTIPASDTSEVGFGSTWHADVDPAEHWLVCFYTNGCAECQKDRAFNARLGWEYTQCEVEKLKRHTLRMEEKNCVESKDWSFFNDSALNPCRWSSSLALPSMDDQYVDYQPSRASNPQMAK